MRDDKDDDDTPGATEHTARLTDEEFDAEVDARKYRRTTALVKTENPPRSKRAVSLSEERKTLHQQGLGQFNFVTTLDPDRRQLIKDFADAVTPNDATTPAAARALLNDPLMLKLVSAIAARPQLLEEIETALSGATDAERGRRTLAPRVAAAVDAVLASPTLNRLVLLLAAAAPQVLELVARLINAANLRAASGALAANPALITLCLKLRADPELTAIFAKTQASPSGQNFLRKAWSADQSIQQALIIALAQPQLLKLCASAGRAPINAHHAMHIAIADPEAPRLGLAVKSMDGLGGLIVRRLVKKHLKSTQRRTSATGDSLHRSH